jgi:hypothetical protein
LHIQFPDGSDNRSDIAIFCEELSGTDTAVTTVLEAFIEILSRGYEKKDLEIAFLSRTRRQSCSDSRSQ